MEFVQENLDCHAIHIVVKLAVTDLSTFILVASQLETESRKEEGCIYYMFLPLDSTESDWIIIEKWKSSSAVEFHNQTPHFVNLVPELIKAATIEFMKKAVDLHHADSTHEEKFETVKPIYLVVGVSVNDFEAFKPLASALSDASRQEHGCLSYSFANVEGSEEECIFVEKWADEEALAAHSQAEHTKSYISQLDVVSTVTYVLKA